MTPYPSRGCVENDRQGHVGDLSKEPKPPIVNQQNLVYFPKCDLCDADYVGFRIRHLHQSFFQP